MSMHLRFLSGKRSHLYRYISLLNFRYLRYHAYLFFSFAYMGFQLQDEVDEQRDMYT
jgi:hypothetical protein